MKIIKHDSESTDKNLHKINSLFNRYKKLYGDEFKEFMYQEENHKVFRDHGYKVEGKGRDRLVLTDGEFVYKIDKSPSSRWNRREVKYIRRLIRNDQLTGLVVPMVGRIRVEDGVVNVFYHCEQCELDEKNRQKLKVMSAVLYDVRPCNFRMFKNDFVCVDPRVRGLTPERIDQFNKMKDKYIDRYGKWQEFENEHHMGYL